MESTLAPADGNKVRLSIHLDGAEMDQAEQAAYRRIARQVRLPGFRPGRAPRKVLEARLGAGYIRAEAMQDAVGEGYQQAVLRHDVDVIAPPEIDITAGKEDGPVSFEALVEVRPEVAADGYDTLSVEVPNPRPTEEEIGAHLDALRAQFSELEPVRRPAIDTDHVTIDVVAHLDGEQVEGLTTSDYTYEVGSGAVVPEIDENLRGASAGDILEFNADHPDPAVDLPLRFRILVKEVQARILPDLNDELVASASEFETVGEFRDDVVRRVGDTKRVQVRMLLRDRVSEAAAALVTAELPASLIDSEADRRRRDLETMLSGRDATLEDYLEATGQSPKQLQRALRDGAEQSVRLDLALRAVAAAEELEPDEADLAASAERAAAGLDLDPAELAERLDGTGGWSALRAERRKDMALDWLMEHVTVTDTEGAPISPEVLAAPDPAEASASEAPDDPAEAPAGTDPAAPAAGASGAGGEHATL